MTLDPRPISPEAVHTAPPDIKPPSLARRWGWRIVKWGLCGLVLAFVGRRAWQVWQQEDWSAIDFEIGWLVLAGLAYAVGWLPSVWFWRRMIRQVGGTVRFDDAARAHFCGQLGKYVPGKATVLIIRSALLKDRGSPVTVSVLTATCETLLMMATGGAVAVALSPLLMRADQFTGWPNALQWIVMTPWLPALIVIAACVVLLPILAELLTLLAVKLTPRGMTGGEGSVRIPPKLIAQGLLAFVGSWILHGLSLGLTLRAVGGEMSFAAWPVWTGGVSVATVVGFAALFAPGGLGVREGLLLEILRIQPTITPAQAVLVPILLRAVWFVTEILIAVAIYYGIRVQPSPKK